MTTITTKYSIGDVVYQASTVIESKRHPCPDCNGLRKWSVKSPAGGEYEIACPRCATRFLNDRDLSLEYSAHSPVTARRTIGSIQVNTAIGSYDSGTRYMCLETGVGSGTIHEESRLFETEEAALVAANLMAAEANSKSEWIGKLYAKSLEISDYQLENAKIKLADEADTKARSLLWNINDLFSTIAEAPDKEAIIEAIDDYKRYGHERDMKAIGKEIASDASADEVAFRPPSSLPSRQAPSLLGWLLPWASSSPASSVSRHGPRLPSGIRKA